MDKLKALSPGTVLHSHDGDYIVLKVLGQGGFGITYLVESSVRVRNIDLKVKFAVKEHFISALCDREADTQRISFSQPVAETVNKSLGSFLKEARRLQSLGVSHPNIVKINEVFEANNTAYYVMEYLEGETLQNYVNARGKLSPQEAERLMRPIAEAVGVLHANRLTHYDIKPENIIIVTESDGSLRPVLIDFGLSKHYDPEGNATSTMGMVGLSRGYAPIEQYHGLTEFTPEADVYSLGATLYFCLTGMTPEEAGKFQIERKLRELNLSLPSKMREGLIHSLKILQEHRTKDAATFAKETFDDFAEFGEPSQDSEKTKIVSTPILPDEKTVAITSGQDEPYKETDHKPETPINYSNSGKENLELSNPKNSKKGKYDVIFSLVVMCIIGLIVWAILYSQNSTSSQEFLFPQDSTQYLETESDTTNIDGHEAVDLGLSVKWATCNVGAENPSDYGDYYVWGETKTRSTYTDAYSVTYDESMNDIGGTQYDVAHTDWGGYWRMPTKDEFQELIDKCRWKWTKVDGHKGYKVTGPNGNSIFLPAAGFGVCGSTLYEGSQGYYWSSTHRSNSDDEWILYFDEGEQAVSWLYYLNERSIRPVSE